MKLPYAKNVSSATQKYMVQFGGINKTDAFAEGEFADMENLSLERFPYLTVRKPYNRGIIATENGRKPNKIWSDGNIFASAEIDEAKPTEAYIKFRNYNQNAVAIPNLEAVAGFDEMGLKKLDFVRINNKLTVFTDDPVTENSSGLISPYTINLDPELSTHEWESTTCSVTAAVDFTENTVTLSEMSVRGGKNGAVNFKFGDTVAIYLETDGEYGEAPDFYGVLNADVTTDAEGKTKIEFTTNVFETLLSDGSGELPSNVKIEKLTPEGLYFATGINNRIWAVRGNTIFASALGEPSRWDSFEGLASDSYQVAVDSSGEFTGISVFDNNPIFFKEDMVYRLYGSLPSNFSLQKVDAPGAMSGCAQSIQRVNEALYYKGRNGVYRYTGAIPQCISEKLGDLSGYDRAVAGADDRYYYLTMVKKEDEKAENRVLYIYDTKTGVWLKNEENAFLCFARWGNVLYASDISGNIISKDIDTKNGLTEKDDSETVAWYAEFKPFNEVVKEKKVYSKLYLRLELDEKAFVSVLIKYDNGAFNEIKTVKADSGEVFFIPISLKKCDSFTVRLEGHNGCTVKTMLREYRTAGDR